MLPLSPPVLLSFYLYLVLINCVQLLMHLIKCEGVESVCLSDSTSFQEIYKYMYIYLLRTLGSLGVHNLSAPIVA